VGKISARDGERMQDDPCYSAAGQVSPTDVPKLVNGLHSQPRRHERGQDEDGLV
jgi:hypothetical protein